MNKKEAEDIGYEIYKFFKDQDEMFGVDTAMMVANNANDTFNKLMKDHPRLKKSVEWWREDPC